MSKLEFNMSNVRQKVHQRAGQLSLPNVTNNQHQEEIELKLKHETDKTGVSTKGVTGGLTAILNARFQNWVCSEFCLSGGLLCAPFKGTQNGFFL